MPPKNKTENTFADRLECFDMQNMSTESIHKRLYIFQCAFDRRNDSCDALNEENSASALEEPFSRMNTAESANELESFFDACESQQPLFDDFSHDLYNGSHNSSAKFPEFVADADEDIPLYSNAIMLQNYLIRSNSLSIIQQGGSLRPSTSFYL